MGKKQILLIEDDEFLRDSTGLFLEEEGYDVIAAKNGVEGVEFALEKIPDLILCDIAMPRMSGYEVFKIISENSVTHSIPFIFLTAKTEKEDIRTGMQMGVDDYITKPFDYDELLRAIELRISKREKLMAASKSGFNALLDSTLTGIFIYQNESIIFANTKFHKIFGYNKDEKIDNSFFKLIKDESREIVVEKIRRCIKGIQNSFSINIEVSTKHCELIKLDLWGCQAAINGQSSFIGNLININEYRSAALNSSEDKNVELASLEAKIVEFSNPDRLTQREIEVLQSICQGFTNQEIADRLFVSNRTIDTHRSNLIDKTGAKNTAGLVVYAIKHNLFNV
ncbi:MAG TPA: hypothetical protein DIW31_04150 [Bacteroidales bacterium]|nr:hypothetical protein [Bacteroidales bacterium]